MPRRQPPIITVTLPCPDCGHAVLSTSDVTVVCIGDVASEVSYTCPTCRVRRLLAASAESLSLLHRAGVRAVELGSGSDHDQEVTTTRQVVSLRVLLDQPDFLSRMDSVVESTKSGVPPVDSVVESTKSGVPPANAR